MTEERVTIADVRAAGYCSPGIRRRCRDLGIDMRRLISEGIPFSEIQNIDDAPLQRSIEVAARRIADGR